MPEKSDRRGFLSGKLVKQNIQAAGEKLADAIVDAGEGSAASPSGGDTVRLTQRTMACDFSVIMNPGPMDRVMMASDALDSVKELEDQLTVYSPESEVSRINASAAAEPVTVEDSLFELIRRSQELSESTYGAFDLTAGPLIALWRRCRDASRIPTDSEIANCLKIVGMNHVALSSTDMSISFDTPGVEINFGAIGKGYALDRSAERLRDHGLDAFLLHGGHSSILALGSHAGLEGWPVGIGNPLFTDKRLGTIVLKNQAMSTSGSNIQYFRHQGKRYGHILDPRHGCPVDGVLSVTAIANDATTADALSTAFYVMGVDAATEFCGQHPDVGAILVPQPRQDRRVRPIIIGVPAEQLFWDSEQILNDESS
ncbi:MAG: FAD:protein FMN transferase [Planctomycetales bacterium]|nr:FAD:protein FMN transferase [Planctomycetales bacterium]